MTEVTEVYSMVFTLLQNLQKWTWKIFCLLIQKWHG